jgi:glycosyltransferase involved in cell wall biosynthesis
MRVLLDVSAVPPRPVGAGVYTLALAHGLAERSDVELHLAARRNDATRWGGIAPKAVVHASVPDPRPLRLLWEQTRGAALAAHIQADVWHGPHYTMPRGLHAGTVVTVHDLTFFDHPEWHERVKVRYFRRMIRYAAENASVLVCDSEYTASRLQARCDPRGEVRVVPLGVDLDRFAPTTNRAADLGLLAAHGIEPPYIAFAGTLEPRKNVPTLIDAFTRVAPTHPNLRLVLAGGDGWGATAVRDATAESGVATRIQRPGYLDDATLVALLRNAELVAYPSFEEGFGLPALEALACATPLVTSDSSAIREVVGDAGLLVAPDDAGALAAAIARILDQPDTARRLRSEGPKRASEYTWDRCVDAYVDAYERAQHSRVTT